METKHLTINFDRITIRNISSINKREKNEFNEMEINDEKKATSVYDFWC